MTLLFICVGGQSGAVAAAGVIAPAVASLDSRIFDKLLLIGVVGIVSGILEGKSAGQARVDICTAALSSLRPAP